MIFRTYLLVLLERKEKKQRKERGRKRKRKERKKRKGERKGKEIIGQRQPSNNESKITITILFLFEINTDLVLYIYVRESIGVYPELDYINLLQCLFKSSNVCLIWDSFVKKKKKKKDITQNNPLHDYNMVQRIFKWWWNLSSCRQLCN